MRQSGFAGLAVWLLSSALPAMAQDVSLASDFAVPAPTIDTRPLDPGPGDKNALVPEHTPSVANSPVNASLSQETKIASNSPAPLMGTSPQTTEPPVSEDATAPATDNAMVNLVNLLVAQKVIAKGAGDKLIQQATQEAVRVHEQVARAKAEGNPANPTAASDDDVQINYVPELVKNQIRDEVAEDLMKQAQDGKLQAKDEVPEWVKRFHVAGDLRVRTEVDFYPSDNDTAGGANFTNYNSINTGSPFNFGQNNPNFPPSYNVNQQRERLRLRARIGAGIDLGENFFVGLRVGTGSDNNPVSENQTLGGANSGQGGNFGKYQIWLDRAFIKYEIGGLPDRDFSVTFGRFDNPFMHTSMIWSDDLGFDGVVAQGKYSVGGGVTPFLTGGIFPVFNTDLNFATNQPTKFSSEDKWLYAAQGGANWTINKDFTVKAAAAFYYFQDVEGKVSNPFVPQSASDAGNTDDSRPSFAQNGNTYIALRDITPDASNNNGLTNQFQYFGLATPFHEVAFTSQVDYSGFDPLHVWMTGEFVKNIAFDRGAILNNGPARARGPQNNFEGDHYSGGDTGWIVKLNAGKLALEQLWDWNITLSYRYIESDATVDGFTDSDFGGSLSGTNLKGFTIGGNLALSSRVWASLRFLSADSVGGPTYKSDVLQFDINAKF